MDQLNPNPLINPNPSIRMPSMLGHPNISLSGGNRPQGGLINTNTLINDQEEKKKEFSRGLFVRGFEKSVTTAMIHHHFSIKPIYGVRHPVTKFKESKGFAFIYYGSEDDALYVKKTLDRTAILKEKVRVSRIVISQNISKMMFKLKTAGLEEKKIQQNEALYFNDIQLELEAERIIKPLFGTHVEVSRITIPHLKNASKPLRYARVFFYVNDLKEATQIAKRATSNTTERLDFPSELIKKNEYETILNCLCDLINRDQKFAKYAKSEIYEYRKKNQTNILYIKGIKSNDKEDPSVLADEIKEFILRQNPQWNINNVYVKNVKGLGAWANVTFDICQETQQAYEAFMKSRPKFRDAYIYANMRNVRDLRVLAISTLRKDVTNEQLSNFLKQLVNTSTKVPIAPGEQTIRKYDVFDFRVIEHTRFFRDDRGEVKRLIEGHFDEIEPYWIEMHEIRRTLVINFANQLKDDDLRELSANILTTPGFESIFLIDKNNQLRLKNPSGHTNEVGEFVKHKELKKNKERAQNRDRPQQPRNNNFNKRGPNNLTNPNVNLNMFSMKGGVPKTTGFTNQFKGSVPQIGVSGRPGIGLPNLGGLTGLGGLGTGLPGLSGASLPGAPLGMGMPRPFNPIIGQQSADSIGSQPPLLSQPPIPGQPMMGLGFNLSNPNPLMGLGGFGLPGFPKNPTPSSHLGFSK